MINNAGYGLFGAAEELSDKDINLILATNLTGSIQMIRAVIPHMRKQGGGRIIQISSYGGQVAYPGNSLYHAAKFGIEGFCESVAQEVVPFNIGVSIIEPGGARTEFRYGSAHIAKLMPEYDNTPAHSFLKMLDRLLVTLIKWLDGLSKRLTRSRHRFTLSWDHKHCRLRLIV